MSETALTSEQRDYIDEFLRTGHAEDPLLASWSGQNVFERAKAAHNALRGTLVAEPPATSKVATSSTTSSCTKQRTCFTTGSANAQGYRSPERRSGSSPSSSQSARPSLAAAKCTHASSSRDAPRETGKRCSKRTPKTRTPELKMSTSTSTSCAKPSASGMAGSGFCEGSRRPGDG